MPRNVTELKELIPILKSNGVLKFKEGGLEIVFHVEQQLPSVSLPSVDISPGRPLSEAIQEMHKNEENSLPPDLRTDNITDADKVLNWSVPNQEDDQANVIPLTGDQQL